MPTKSVGSRSFRWGTPLDADEITQSREILHHIGVNADVAEAIAPSLHPAESWALWCYARGARLGPAWIASQCYDFVMRRPRPAGLAPRYDEAGRLLVVLPQAQAELVIDIIDQHCPRSPEALYADPQLADASPAQWSAVEAAWAVMAEQRRGQSRIAPRAAQPSPTGASTSDNSVWPAVQKRLAQDVSAADWRTWIEPLALLEIDEGTAIVGAPNVFSRDQVAAIYAGPLEESLAAELGRTVRVEVVIGTSVLV